jgi:F-box/leucine-rich repeat protein 2/20
MGNCVSVDEDDYFSLPVAKAKLPIFKRRENFNFWQDMPSEIRMEVLSYLQPKEVVRCSRISKLWYGMCFDGQLWATLDTSPYYRDIPGDALVNIISSAGPFVRDLNLRGCVQLRERWSNKGKLNPESLVDAVRNLENFSLEGCQIDRSSIHCFLLQNHRLVHINLSGLPGATNHAMKIIAQYCPKVEHLNVTWCCNVNTRGLRRVVQGCPKLRDLRAGEVQGWDDEEFMLELFERNTLERLLLPSCSTLTDDSLKVLLEGVDSEYDYLTGRVIAPPRKLKHLDLTHCRGLTEDGIRKLAHTCPNMEGLQLSKCPGITDTALGEIFPTMPRLTHLDIDELGHNISNSSLQALAASPCHATIQHLSISYCEDLGDQGMVPVIRSCTKLTSLDMDNTKISDLVLTEVAAMVRDRSRSAGSGLAMHERPNIGLRLVVYDCAHVTWTGVREVLSRNAEATLIPRTSTLTYPREVIQLKCFYNWQPTVEEHSKRVMRGDFASAGRLERKWAEYMVATEEAGVSGGGGRNRRRRAREAQMMHADEENGGMAGTGIGRRRRARSGPSGCVMM